MSCITFQELNRHNYVTPTCYLELISSYGDLLEKKRNELNLGIIRLSTGTYCFELVLESLKTSLI